MSDTTNTTPDRFDAMGNPVPLHRKSNALTHLRQMNPNLTGEQAMTTVDSVANAIEQDRPYQALNHARNAVDGTGAYRLFSALCVGEKPSAQDGGHLE